MITAEINTVTELKQTALTLFRQGRNSENRVHVVIWVQRAYGDEDVTGEIVDSVSDAAADINLKDFSKSKGWFVTQLVIFGDSELSEKLHVRGPIITQKGATKVYRDLESLNREFERIFQGVGFFQIRGLGI